MIGNSVIKLEKVDVYQQKHLVLSDVNLHIDKGEFVFLIGLTHLQRSVATSISVKWRVFYGIPGAFPNGES